jgi:hypothetical protein
VSDHADTIREAVADLRKHIRAMRGTVWDSYAESAEESLDALAARCDALENALRKIGEIWDGQIVQIVQAALAATDTTRESKQTVADVYIGGEYKGKTLWPPAGERQET